MIYSNRQPDVGLASVWRCQYVYANGSYKWQYLAKPTTVSGSATFAIDLPFDAVIKRVWLTMVISTPVTGSAVQKVNDLTIPSSGEVELDKTEFTAETETWNAVFTFRANGAIYSDPNLHEARITFVSPTLHIEYTSVSNPDEGGDSEEILVSRPLDTGVQLPRLLDSNFHEVARIDPDNLRLQLKLDPKSGATMRVPLSEPEVKVGDWLELFSPHGSEGIFRAIEVETVYGYQGERTVYMEHAIGVLEDSLAIGTQSMSAPVATVFATLLETQNVRHWVLGDCEVPEDYELIYEYSYDNLLHAIVSLTAELPPEYMWEFDTMRHPFVMHLRKLPEDDRCEVRMSRNLTSSTLTINSSDLCTRLIPFGAGEGKDRVTLTALTGSQHIDSPTAETWGLVTKTITAGDVYDAPTLKLVAERYLERYGDPLVSVVLNSMDIYEATGERLDYFRNGAVCRVALPEYGTTLHERVITVTWPDVFNQPERCEIQLANRIRDAADEIAELMREATNSKLLGGTVETVEETARAGSITPISPYSQSFAIEGYGNVLNVKIDYRCVTTITGEDVACHVVVDGTEIDDTEASARLVDITRYLASDESGVITVGKHTVTLLPATLNNVASEVDNTITIKQIGKR